MVLISKTSVRYIFLAVISCFIFLISNQALAESCEADLGGKCEVKQYFFSSPCESGYMVYGNKGDYGCTDLRDDKYCCIPKCSTLGKKCVSKDICGKEESKKLQRECGSNESCCEQSLCEASKYSCLDGKNSTNAQLDKCESAGDKFNSSCLAFYNVVGAKCCKNSTKKESSKCEDHSKEGYYCVKNTTGCSDDDYSTSKYKCSNIGTDSAVCCKKTVKKNSDDDSTSFGYFNPLNIKSITGFLVAIVNSIRSIVGWLAVIFIVFGGIVYIVSGGSSMTNWAKDIITWALIGFALAVAAPTILKEIYDLASGGTSSGSDVIDNAITIKEIILNVLSFLLEIIGILALLGFIIGAFMYLSPGKPDNAETGKKAVFYSIIAVSLAGAGLIIINQIISIIGG